MRISALSLSSHRTLAAAPARFAVGTSAALCTAVLLSVSGCGYPSRSQEEAEPAQVSSANTAESEPEGSSATATAGSGDGPTWSDDRDPTSTPEDVGSVPAYASRTASGLASHVLRPGTGSAHPSATSRVTVNYSGWTTDGEMFDSSWARGQPATFPLNGVIGGWTEGVQLMTEGEIRRFWIPAELAYGENPGGGRPGGLLVFDIELISVGG